MNALLCTISLEVLQQRQTEKKTLRFGKELEETVYTVNQARSIKSRNPEVQFAWLPAEGKFQTRMHPDYVWHAQGEVEADSLRLANLEEAERTCVLLNTTMIDEKWIKPYLKPLISADDCVCVLAMSFFDDTKNAQDWDRQYGPGRGIWYRSHQDVFYPYGLKPDQIFWVNPFEDDRKSMQQKILASSILLLPGGAPELFMRRIRKNGLKKILQNYQGLVIGCSAGSMIQLGTYHISPDADYPEFLWDQGLGYLPQLDIEAHYHASKHQKECIKTAQQKHHLPVYAIYEQGGLIAYSNGSLALAGQVDVFDPMP